jgi:hypothetical protein
MRRARARAARIARAKRAAAQKRRLALERAHRRERALERAHRRERAQTRFSGPAADSPSSPSALPYLIAAFAAALVLLGLALTPARAVPWHRAARALEARRDELGVIGGTSLVAMVLFFLLVEVTQS